MSSLPAIRDIKITPVEFELKNPFVTSLGEKTVSKNVIVSTEWSDGTMSLGEVSGSLVNAILTQEVMLGELTQLKQKVTGMKLEEAFHWVTQEGFKQVYAASACAFEMALFSKKAAFEGKKLYQLFGNHCQPLETCFTISAWQSDLAEAIALQEWNAGFRKFKIKVGTGLDEDFKRICSVAAVAPKAELVLDGNQGFTVQSVTELIIELKKKKIEISFIEQPLSTDTPIEAWVELKQKLQIPIALDESISSTEEAEDYIRHHAVDIINVKLAKSGIQEALNIIQLAQKNSVSLMIGCMAESVVGITPAVHLASGTGAFDFVDLDSFYLLKPQEEYLGDFEWECPTLSSSSEAKDLIDKHL